MVEAYEKKYGFEYVDMTSWVGNSFSAYLNKKQVEALRNDSGVAQIEEVIEADVSSSPPWYNSSNGSETFSWGRNAVNGKISNGSRRVYILDTGVGYHSDLTNVTKRVNASCGRETNTNHYTSCPQLSSIGCYAHATHVAGIIGAAYGNGGVAGVNAGANLISVAVGHQNKNSGTCSSGTDSISIIGALDWIKWDIILNSGPGTAIVNISINSAAFTPLYTPALSR